MIRRDVAGVALDAIIKVEWLITGWRGFRHSSVREVVLTVDVFLKDRPAANCSNC